MLVLFLKKNPTNDHSIGIWMNYERYKKDIYVLEKNEEKREKDLNELKPRYLLPS